MPIHCLHENGGPLKQIFGFLLIACLWIGDNRFAEAQSLSQKLIDEGATRLAQAAREKGDAVRGAIIYSQKKLNCTQCHARGATDLLGPDLTRIGKEVKDEFFVESVLQPSKVIKQEFETVNVLTVGGQVFTGRVITEDDQSLTLRDTSPASRLLKLPKQAIEVTKRNPKSSMPDGLADQMDDRQQFLDLVKYLMDIAATSTDADTVHPVASGTVQDRIRGLALLDELLCTSCHHGNIGGMMPSKSAPDLASSLGRIDPQYVARFIAQPHRVKPGTTMPDVMGSMQPSEKQVAAKAITHYLLSLAGSHFDRQAIDGEAASRGQTLFHSVGCVACHSPRDERGAERPIDDSVALGRVEEKYSLQGLVSFLKDPHSSRPSGRMPNMTLSHWEAVDIASYLLQRTPEPKENQEAVSASLASVGKQKFRQFGCADCHRQEGIQPHKYTPLEELTIDRGCLSDSQGTWPDYQLDAKQRDTLRLALDRQKDRLTETEQIELTMHTLRCYRCHSRDGIGGVSEQRNDHFHTSNQNLGPQGRMPPSLTGVGAKLKPKWLRSVLVAGRSIRPYMKTRMPQYGDTQMEHLVDLLGRADQSPGHVTFGNLPDHKEAKKIGTELVGRGGLNCVACHTFQQKPAQTMPAVDLTEMADRLHKEWFYRYMLSPQSLSPGTVMPSFWPGGKAIRKEILAGDPNQQLEAIWQWLADGRQARTPRGLIFKPIELVATEEAVMLRRRYQGIGKRGIGVGYPSGVNLAFDAQQLRLAMIWKGKFADPGGVWSGQGSGNVRPLGADLIRMVRGPDLDRKPWLYTQDEDRRPPDHQFTGYYLDSLRRPTFTYRLGDVEVEDYSVGAGDDRAESQPDSTGRSTLKRTVTFTSPGPREDLFFRVADGQSIAASGDHFRIDQRLVIRIGPSHTGQVIRMDKGACLVVPLQLSAGKTKLTIEYSW